MCSKLHFKRKHILNTFTKENMFEEQRLTFLCQRRILTSPQLQLTGTSSVRKLITVKWRAVRSGRSSQGPQWDSHQPQQCQPAAPAQDLENIRYKSHILNLRLSAVILMWNIQSPYRASPMDLSNVVMTALPLVIERIITASFSRNYSCN